MQGGRKPTKAERKEQARKKRLEELKRRQRKQRMRRIYGAGLALLAVAGIALVVIISQQASNKRKEEIDKLATAAGCTPVQSPEEQTAAPHLQPDETFQYNTKPPSSGRHFGQTAQTGVHTEPIDARSYVHNLEHGNVVILYKPDTDQNIITLLEGVAREDTTRIVVAPYTDMDYKVAMTTWGKLIGCNDPNTRVDDLAKRFFADFRGKGPEGDVPGQPRAGA